MIRILLVDDSEILIKSLKIILEQDPELMVVGAARNGQEAFELCQDLFPEIVLMDIRMPVCNGVMGTRLIKASCPKIKVLVLTTFDDREYIETAIQNGADGYVLKDLNENDLVAAIKGTVRGFSIMHQNAFQIMRDQITSVAEDSNQPPSLEDKLTKREREIVLLIVAGLANKEIANRLGISEGTVRNIVSGVLAKLSLNDRTQLAVYAVKHSFSG